jgi:hypothetical protein
MEKYEKFNETAKILIDEHHGTAKKVINSDRDMTAHSTVASVSHINSINASKNIGVLSS